MNREIWRAIHHELDTVLVKWEVDYSPDADEVAVRAAWAVLTEAFPEGIPGPAPPLGSRDGHPDASVRGRDGSGGGG